MIALPMLYTPIFILEFIKEWQDEKIEKALLNFLLQLKNYTKLNNDIVYALKEVKTTEPLRSYLEDLLLEINSGLPFEIAISNFAEKINHATMKTFFSNLTYCYLYGGDFSVLISKSYDMIDALQKEKEKRKSETKSARVVLYLLILLDLFVYFTNIQEHVDNYLIMQKSIIGNLILYWNFISLWLLLLLARKVKELDY